MDIAMVFLNAGGSTPGSIYDLTEQEYQTIFRLNLVQPIYLTKALLPQMLKRKQRNALVLTSSVISRVPAVASCPYSCSKAGAALFFEALHYELSNNIEVFCWDCGGVKTKINPFKVGLRSNTQQAVSGCFKDLGRETRSFGSW